MKPRVVWAIQAPTLLNILAKSESWDMQVANFGDASMQEVEQLQAPKWDGSAKNVKAVFVCSPAHVEQARKHLPKVPIVRVAHQGYYEKVPECDESQMIVAFSDRVRYLLRANTLLPVHVLHPCFEPTATWKFEPNKCWTMMSRPSTREPIVQAGLDTVRGLAKRPILVYGQDQSQGFLTAELKTRLLSRSSAYVSILPSRSGFGLSQHEAMASGCPVIGSWWGDLMLHPSWEIRHAFREYDDFYGLAKLCDRMSEGDDALVRLITNAQYQYLLDNCNASRMSDNIECLLGAIARG